MNPRSNYCVVQQFNLWLRNSVNAAGRWGDRWCALPSWQLTWCESSQVPSLVHYDQHHLAVEELRTSPVMLTSHQLERLHGMLLHGKPGARSPLI